VSLIILSFIFRALRWKYLIRSMKEIKTVNLFSPLMVGFMSNMLPARAGEFIRAYLLGKKENISFSASFATIIVERLFDLAIVLLLLFYVLFFNSDIFSQGFATENHKLMSYMFTFGQISFAGCLLIFVFSIFMQYKNSSAMKIVNVCVKPLPEKWGKKIVSMAVSFAEGFSIVRDKRGFIAATSLSLLILASFILFNYPLYLAFEIENSLPLLSSLAILCLAVDIFVALFPTPGFLGAFQAAYVVALHEIFGISKAVAVSLGIVAWLVTMGTIIAAGTFFIIRENISIGKLAAEKQSR